jgi:hypothetical protein
VSSSNGLGYVVGGALFQLLSDEAMLLNFIKKSSQNRRSPVLENTFQG